LSNFPRAHFFLSIGDLVNRATSQRAKALLDWFALNVERGAYAKASGRVASKAIKTLANIESGSPLSTMQFCSQAVWVMAAGPA
jgi:hypothetical protein